MDELIKMLQDNLREAGDQMLFFRQKAYNQQAEIDELMDMLENMVFNANLHHNDALELLYKYKGE